MSLMREIDPEGVAARARRRLVRRTYFSSGSNQCWHIDGYDKLKPYGLAIHGCIDGFSRKILWLKVVESNNNPIIMASIFLETVRKLKFCPQKLRTDLGTENCTMADCQCFLVESANAHFYGTSVANQRIENWWSFLKRSFTSWIIDFFKRLVAEGNLILGHRVHLKCVWYVFSTFIQSQLDEVVHEWKLVIFVSLGMIPYQAYLTFYSMHRIQQGLKIKKLLLERTRLKIYLTKETY